MKTPLAATVALSLLSLTLACGGSSSQQKPAANNAHKAAAGDALKTLQKVRAATQVGVNRPQYGSLVIDAQAAVNESLLKLPDGELKNEIKAAMEAYADANSLWSERGTEKALQVGQIKDAVDIRLISELGTKLQAKYEIPIHPLGQSNLRII